jgi:hypothetical protein
MATKEFELAEMLRADTALMALLAGGVYTDEEIGIEGFHRGESDPLDPRYSSTALAFDEDGYLKPCALVRQLGEAVVPRTQDLGAGFQAIGQTVQVYYYQDRGHDIIELARARGWAVLNAKRIGRSYPAWCENQSPYIYEVGPIQNVTTLRQDWRVVYTKQD